MEQVRHLRPTASRHAKAGASWIAPQHLSDLIGSIYDCTLDPARWEETLTQLMELMLAESVILSLNDLRSDRALIEKSVGWGQDGLTERRRHIPEIHARLNEWFAGHPSPDAPYVCSQELSAAYLEGSPYVRRCLKPRGIVDVMHQFLMRTPSHFSELVVARHERNGPITVREVEIAALLLPHIRRAVTISRVLDAQTIEKDRMTQALDALRCGVVITDGAAAILHANRPAGHMLRDGAVLNDTGGALGVRRQGAAQELRKAIRLACEDEAALGATGVAIRLTQDETPPLFAHVLPMKGGAVRARIGSEAAAAVFIGESAPAAFDPTEAKDRLRAAFGLTEAEVAVALEIAKGDGRAAAAARLGIAVTTIRAHLSHIYEKTGAGRQAELVRLVLRGGPESAP